MKTVHRPVMAAECVKAMDLSPGQIAVDGTTGGGGHTLRIAKAVGPTGRVLAFDRDPTMLERAKVTLSAVDDCISYIPSSYVDLKQTLDELSLPAVDAILVDLGLSSDQLADAERGFGFKTGGPLDLRFNQSVGIPAFQWLADSSDEEVRSALEGFSDLAPENPLSIAVVEQRKRLATAQDLADLAVKTVGMRGKSHPATVLFQALRIAVNDELQHVSDAVSTVFPACLKEGGRLAVLTFHSIEDRIVKQALRSKEVWTYAQKKPILPRPAEVRDNPRSRSAKLRVAIRSGFSDAK